MKVKIVKCSDRENSYGHLVGKVVEVHNSNHVSCVIVDGNCVYNVSNKDTIPVSEIRYEIRDSKKIIKSCITSCEHIRDTSVGSWACEKCEHNCGIDKVNQIVLCSWQKMKRLDVRKDYEDENIGIKPYNELKYYWIEIKNNGHDIMAIKLGAYGVSLDQANATLKVMGLDYELYEMDWSKVEEGAEVKYSIDLGNGMGQGGFGNFYNYIPNLNKVILIVGNDVIAVDEDEVELC